MLSSLSGGVRGSWTWRIVNGLLQVGLPRVLDSKQYSSNVSVLEYSFNSASGQKVQFPVPVFQINKQLLELYANLPGSFTFKLRLASCELCDLIH